MNCPFRFGGNQFAPGLFYVACQLGEIAWLEGNSKEMDRYFGLSFSLNPTYAKARYIYTMLLMEENRTDDALEQINIIEKIASPYSDRAILRDVRDNIRPALEQ